MPGNVTLVEVSPVKSALLLWKPAQGAPVLTVICKATYDLRPGVAPLADAQDDVNLRDLHSENNPKLGLYSASDMVPYKPRADVTVVGRAFAPPNELAHSVVARVNVGSVDKRVEVCAERYINRNGKLRSEAVFSKMSIGYERAPGGPNTINPVGRSMSAEPDDKGRVALPNLQVPGQSIAGRGTELTPTGFGPVPASWPTRRALLPAGAAALDDGGDWDREAWLEQPVPPQWNWAFFNVAPIDQQLDEVRCDARVLLEYLHPDEAKLETKLSGHRPVVFLEHKKNAEAVPMRGDTLWIDTNRLVQTLTWRGQITLADLHEEVRVHVAMAEPGADLTWDQVWAADQKVYDEVTVVQTPSSSGSPPSSGAHQQKTRAAAPASKQQSRKLSSPASARFTSPVPLVPSSDHTPNWLPTAMPAVAVSRTAMAQVLEVPLTDAEADALAKMSEERGCSPIDLVKQLLHEAHAKER